MGTRAGPDSEALVFVPTPEAVRLVAKALPLVGAGGCALQLRGPPGSGKTVRRLRLFDGSAPKAPRSIWAYSAFYIKSVGLSVRDVSSDHETVESYKASAKN